MKKSFRFVFTQYIPPTQPEEGCKTIYHCVKDMQYFTYTLIEDGCGNSFSHTAGYETWEYQKTRLGLISRVFLLTRIWIISFSWPNRWRENDKTRLGPISPSRLLAGRDNYKTILGLMFWIYLLSSSYSGRNIISLWRFLAPHVLKSRQD